MQEQEYFDEGYKKGYEEAVNRACEWFEDTWSVKYWSDIDLSSSEFIKLFKEAMKGGDE